MANVMVTSWKGGNNLDYDCTSRVRVIVNDRLGFSKVMEEGECKDGCFVGSSPTLLKACDSVLLQHRIPSSAPSFHEVQLVSHNALSFLWIQVLTSHRNSRPLHLHPKDILSSISFSCKEKNSERIIILFLRYFGSLFFVMQSPNSTQGRHDDNIDYDDDDDKVKFVDLDSLLTPGLVTAHAPLVQCGGYLPESVSTVPLVSHTTHPTTVRGWTRSHWRGDTTTTILPGSISPPGDVSRISRVFNDDPSKPVEILLSSRGTRKDGSMSMSRTTVDTSQHCSNQHRNSGESRILSRTALSSLSTSSSYETIHCLNRLHLENTETLGKELSERLTDTDSHESESYVQKNCKHENVECNQRTMARNSNNHTDNTTKHCEKTRLKPLRKTSSPYSCVTSSSSSSSYSSSTSPKSIKTSTSASTYHPSASTFTPPPSLSSSVLRVLVISLLFFFLVHPAHAQRHKSPRKSVRIHAILPRHFAMLNDLKREFHNTVINFKRDSRNSAYRAFFSIRETITFLDDDTPAEILGTFCDDVLNNQTITVINVNNPLGMRRRSASSRYILNLSQYWGVPIINWDTEFSGTPQGQYEYRTLQLAPTISHQVRAMTSLLNRYNWTHFSVVTSRVAGDMEFVSAIETAVEASKKLPRGNGVRRKRMEILSTLHIDDHEKSKEKLTRFVGSDTRVFLLHCTSLASYSIIESAVSLGLTGKDYVWILTRSCIPTAKYAPKSFPLGLLGISFDHGVEAMKVVLRVSLKTWLYSLVKLAKHMRSSKMTIPPNLSCKSTERQFWNDGDIFYNYMLNTTIRDEPNIVFNRNGTLTNTELSIVNLQWHDGQRKKKDWREVGRWKRYGLKMKSITWPGESPMAPTGKPKRAFVKVVTLYEKPYVVYRNVTEDGTCEENALPCHIYVRDRENNILKNSTILKCCVGLSMDLLKLLSTELNFDYRIEEVKDGSWGGTDAKGNWNGLVKALINEEFDMCFTSLKINPERAGAVEFSLPYLETGIKIIVALRDGAISPTAFLEPYDYASWSLILIFSVHATGSSILIFEWLSPKGLNRGLTPLRDHKFSLFRSFWLIWAMLFSTSVQTDSPRGIASRFLANIWALFALVFLASYTANLAAFMITKEEYYDLSGIKDHRLQNPYVMNPPFKYATTAYGSTEAMLKANHQAMYKYMKKLNLPTVDSGIRALKAGDIQAFIYDSSVLEYYASRDPKCRLVTVGNRYAMTGYGVGFPPKPNNPWIDKVNRVILKLQENGELDRLQKFWLAGACDTKKEAGVSNRTLGIINFTSAFILLGSGILLGLVLLVSEHLYFKFGRKQLRKADKCGCCALVSLSMGRSLRMKDTVTEAMSMVAKNRCKDPLCETQMWKLKHKLDMALLKIENLENQLSISEGDLTDGEPRPLALTLDESEFDDSWLPNHNPNNNVRIHQQPLTHQPTYAQPHRSQQQQQQHQQLPRHNNLPRNNIGNHNNIVQPHRERTITTPVTPSPYFTDPRLVEVHTIPEVSYSKDSNGDSCHIRASQPPRGGGGGPQHGQITDNPALQLQQHVETPTSANSNSKADNNFVLSANKSPDYRPPSYADCLNDGFNDDDEGGYAQFSGLDDIDSEGGSTHSTATTSLGATATGKLSPWPGLKRSPSYTSAVGGSFGSDIDRKSPSVTKSRKYDGKTYMGVGGL